jgi:HPt (histidine-containing phosphotransfer) domain-containing protein
MSTISAPDAPGGSSSPGITTTPLHVGALADLAGEVGIPVATRFVRRFLEMLGPRVRKLREATSCQDAEAAHVAALSLHSSAAMVGATALAETAAGLVDPLCRGDLLCASAALPILDREATEVRRALLAVLEETT